MKKVLSLLLAAMMIFSSVPAVFAAFADEARWPSSVSWAKNQISYMVDKGVLNGYAEDNTFRPADPVTRVQFIKMIVETFGLTATATISYSDVKSTDWFYPYVQKAAAQGFLLNYGTQLDPNGQLTREEAAALLVRYLGLDASKKSPTSTYKDYSSIKIKYQDYVLQATYESLFNGDETGNFSPTRVLRRCEAAAILYRAAGTIYQASATGTDAGAAGENAVIAKPGVIVSSANIKGELYISEGASGGIVMLNGCTLDKVILRGTAAVTFSDCTIKELVVDVATANHTAGVTVNGGTKIDAVTAKSAAKIDLSSNTEITAMTVETAAKNSSVTGSGALKSATVKATGFKAEMMPAKYEISSGITASFAGTTYSGTADAGASGFTVAPTMYTTTANGYLTGKPAVGGTVYFYFTNTATVPTASSFTSLYNAAAARGTFIATANVPFDKDVGTVASISSYSYIAVMVQNSNGTVKYQPILLPNRTSSGFVGTPTLTVSGAYDKLTVTSTVKGEVYYYYAKTNTAPTVDTFSTMYNAAVYKGFAAVSANTQLSKQTVQTSTVASYPYLIVLVMDATGNRYQPVVISKSGTSAGTTDTGFTTTPFTSKEEDTIRLGMVAGANGTVEYYYTTASTLPSAEQFTSTYASMASSAKGTISVSKGVSHFDVLPNQVVATAYRYIVLRLTAGGVIYQPVVVMLPVADAANLAGTGFAAQPTSYMTGGYFYLTVNTTSSSQLFYYITNNATPPSVSAFEANWANKTSDNLEEPSGGAMAVTPGQRSYRTQIKNEIGINHKYIVLMNVIGTTKMTPVLIPLVGGTQGGATVQPTTTGFTATPYCSNPTQRTHQVTVTPSIGSGMIYYYYTDTSAVPTTEDVIRIVEAEMSAGMGTGSYAGIYAISGKRTYNIQVEIINQLLPKYVVLMLVDGTGTQYLPVVISTSATSGGSTNTENMTGTGFNTKPTAKLTGTSLALTYSTTAAGQILYYFSTSSVAPVDSASFVNNYHSGSLTGSMRGTLTVGAGAGTKTITAPLGYAYLVIMLQKTNVGVNDTPFCHPIVIPVSGTTGSVAGFSGKPYVRDDLLYYYPTMTGQLRYYFTNTDSIGDFSESLEELGSAALTAGTVSITTLGQNTLRISTATALGELAKTFKNIVIWIDNGTVTTEMMFVSLSDNSGNQGSQGGTQTPTASGFSSGPRLDGVTLFFTPNVTGTVKYFYTNSNTTYTNASFPGAYVYQVQQGVGFAQPVTKDRANFIDVTAGASFKYMWLMLDTGTSAYTPVCIQLY